MSKRALNIVFTFTLIIGIVSLLFTKEGISQKLEYSSGIYPEITVEIDTFYFENVNINGTLEKSIKINGVFLPVNPGNPDLPVITRMLNVPKGAKLSYEIIETVSYIVKNISVAPSPMIQNSKSPAPYIYTKNEEVYSKDKNYPDDIVSFSEVNDIRGIYTSLIGVTPFKYNPVKKELTVFKKLKMKISFTGGQNYYEERLRNPFFDGIIIPNILNPENLNRNKLKETDNPPNNGYEYLIIVPDNPYFKRWADSLSKFRNEQGIKTGVFKTSEIGGNNFQNIRNYISSAYYNWEIPPVAVLILGDYGTNANINITSNSYNSFITDQKYGDMNNDFLPDIIISRIPATDESDVSGIIMKIINSERNPTDNLSYYNKVITALGWETVRWYQLCAEIIGGYFRNKLFKTTARINAIYNGNPTIDPWSTAENTQTILNYFGPSGLNYIPSIPQTLGGFSGGTGSMIVNEINSGAFFVFHRDHGNYSLWGEPYFNTGNINQTTNINLLTVLSINCLTGGFAWQGGDCIAERFLKHTYNGNPSGAASIIAASGESYPFYNDVYSFGVMDNLFNDFMPAVNSSFSSYFSFPAFATAAGKIFLHQSSFVSDSGLKKETNYLFHHFGDAFYQMPYSVPANIQISHSDTALAGEKGFIVNTESNTLIAITNKGTLLGKVLTSSSGNINIQLTGEQSFGDTLKLTATKQNKKRYESYIRVLRNPNALLNVSTIVLTDPVPYGNGNGIPDYTETNFLSIKVTNSGLSDAVNSTAVLSSADTNIVLLDSVEYIPLVSSMNYVILLNSLKFFVKGEVPNNRVLNFKIRLNFGNNFTDYYFSYTAKSPVINYLTKVIKDSTGNNNRQVDPGEIGKIICPLRNTGGSISRNNFAKIYSYSPFVTLHVDSISYPDIGIGDSVSKFFVFKISDSTQISTVLPFKIIYRNALQNSVYTDSFYYVAGGSGNIIIGNGTNQTYHPLPGYFTDSRTQMIYTAEEILAAGGFMGIITKVGFKLNLYQASYFSNVSVKLKHTNSTILTGFEGGAFQNCYNGPLSVTQSGIWNYMVLSNPFHWDGQSNLVIEICYNLTSKVNSVYTVASNYQNRTYTCYLDDPFSHGCDLPTGTVMHYRPNVALAINEIIPVREDYSTIPSEIFLENNFPNPFNPVTRIKYGIPTQSIVSIKIYDILGRLIETPVNGNIQAGTYYFDFNGDKLSSGIYFCLMTIDNKKTIIKKMVLQK